MKPVNGTYCIHIFLLHEQATRQQFQIKLVLGDTCLVVHVAEELANNVHGLWYELLVRMIGRGMLEDFSQ